jgi:hypothetical protein
MAEDTSARALHDVERRITFGPRADAEEPIAQGHELDGGRGLVARHASPLGDASALACNGVEVVQRHIRNSARGDVLAVSCSTPAVEQMSRRSDAQGLAKSKGLGRIVDDLPILPLGLEQAKMRHGIATRALGDIELVPRGQYTHAANAGGRLLGEGVGALCGSIGEPEFQVLGRHVAVSGATSDAKEIATSPCRPRTRHGIHLQSCAADQPRSDFADAACPGVRAIRRPEPQLISLGIQDEQPSVQDCCLIEVDGRELVELRDRAGRVVIEGQLACIPVRARVLEEGPRRCEEETPARSDLRLKRASRKDARSEALWIRGSDAPGVGHRSHLEGFEEPKLAGVRVPVQAAEGEARVGVRREDGTDHCWPMSQSMPLVMP